MTNIHPTAVVAPGAELGEGVEVGPYGVIGPHVRLGPGTRLMSHVVIDGHTSLGRECTVFPFASLGTLTQDLKYRGGAPRVEIGDRTTIREYATVNTATADGDATRVGSGCLIMACAHVAHDCRVGDGVIIANGTGLSGHVVVEDQAIFGGMCGIHQFCRIGRMSMIGGLSRVTQDVPPYMICEGNPATVPAVNLIGLQRRGLTDEAIRGLREAHRILYRSGLNTSQAVERIDREVAPCAEIAHLLEFIRGSERGITR